jgi:preprotein translocase subunit SecF
VLDIQFQGGTVITIETDKSDVNVQDVETGITELIDKEVTVQKLSTYNPEDENARIELLNVKIASKEPLDNKELNDTIALLRSDYGAKENANMDVQSVDPSIGKELMTNGLNAVILASFLIIIYIWIRFSVMSGLTAALFAVLALMHDAAIMFSVYTVFKIPLNGSFCGGNPYYPGLFYE